MLTTTVIPYVLAAFALAMALNLWRLLKGPALPDRILALDTLYINSLAVLVLLSVYLNIQLYFEAALVIAMLGFVGTVVLSKFIINGAIFE